MKQQFTVSQWEEVACPVCGARASSFYEKFGHKHEFTYVRCMECQTVYQNPRPIYDEAFVRDAYENYAENRWHYEQPDYFDKEAIQFDKELNEILQFDPVRTRVLDVGCGVGLFLYSAKKVYSQVAGIEISESNAVVAENILGIPIYRGSFEQYQPGVRFSCINISHVIEHVPNPNEWLKKARLLLDPGGVLVIDVPNWFGWAQRFKWALKRIGLRKGKWPATKVPEHLYEPAIPGMRWLFASNGFCVVHYYTYSRKDLVSRRWWSRIFHRRWKAGSNLRFYLKME